MTAAFKSHGKGTLVLKGTFGGVKIERATGTNDPKRVEDLRAMCRTLKERGRYDILHQLASGKLKLLEAWGHSGDWSKLPTPEHAKKLTTALEAWRKSVKHKKRRHDLRSTIKRLLKGHRKPMVGNLASILLAYRHLCEAKNTARMFNKTRSEMSSFVKSSLTQDHPLWRAIRAVAPLPVTPKHEGNPQKPDGAKMIRETLGGEWGRAWWAMCCTGMMPDEFFGGKWRMEDGRLRILGTKTVGPRDRYVPLLWDDVHEPVMSQEQFQRKLARSGLGVVPYDGRRTFKHWCDLVGIPNVASEIYMGHATGYRMDTLYGAHASERYLTEHTALLVGLLVGSKTSEPQDINGPTRNRTENLLIKRQQPDSTLDALTPNDSDLQDGPYGL